jgi:VWFA-related protein
MKLCLPDYVRQPINDPKVTMETATPARRIRLVPNARTLQALIALFILGVLVGFPAAEGQQSAPSPGQTQVQSEDRDQSAVTLKVRVNVVQLLFNVKDKKGNPIANLGKDEFEILEDDKPQAIKYFAAESNLPLTMGILIDSSASQARVLQMEKQIGGEFLSEILRNKDLAFVLGVDVNVDLLQDFTNSVPALKAALNSARINTAGGRTTGGAGPNGGAVPTGTLHGTLLYDAVYLASRDELARQAGRKAMILLTDGEDQGSQRTIKDAIEAAQKSDSIVYVLLCADRNFYGSGEYSGEAKMMRLTQATGGRVIRVGNKVDKLKDAFNQIANELRSQYNIGYTPTNTAFDGTFRKVEIHAKGKDYKIQARAGYYAAASRD